LRTHTSEESIGGTRPDQHNIDAAEGSTPDHKRRGEGRSGDERINNQDKQLERQTETDDIRHAMRTDEHEDARKGMKVEKGTQEESRDRVDEASEESFPASDPPQQP